MNMWRCDYCGHSQTMESRKCADCGGPRQADTHATETRPFTEYLINSDEYWETYGGQCELLEMRVKDIHAEIGKAFVPALTALAETIIGR